MRELQWVTCRSAVVVWHGKQFSVRAVALGWYVLNKKQSTICYKHSSIRLERRNMHLS